MKKMLIATIIAFAFSTSAFAKSDKHKEDDVISAIRAEKPFETGLTQIKTNPNDGGGLPGCGPSGGQPDKCDVPAVPVPSAMILMGTGLAGLIGFSRRKKV